MELRIERRGGVTSLHVDPFFLDEALARIEEGGVDEIVVGSTGTWKGRSLDFLAKIRGVGSLVIVDPPGFTFDRAPILAMTGLSSLCVDTMGLDISVLTKLRSLRTTWDPKLPATMPAGVSSLALWKVPVAGLPTFPSAANLEKLDLTDSRIVDLQCLIQFSSLRELVLSLLTKVELVAPLRHLAALERLRIELCRKVKDVEELAVLTRLRELDYVQSGAIKSAAFLAKLPALSSVNFYGTKVLDGDYSLIRALTPPMPDPTA